MVHNWGGRLPSFALEMMLLKKFMNPLTHAGLSCRSLPPGSPSTRGPAWCPVIYLFFTFIIINAIIIVWICEAINQSSRNGKNLRRNGEEASVLQTFFLLSGSVFSSILVGPVGLFLLAFSLESCLMDSRHSFALYLAYLFHKAA